MTLTETTRRKIVILGGGAAGMAVFARLHEKLRYPHVTLIEPSTTCQYPPFSPLVGVGAAHAKEAVRGIANSLPETSFWIRDEVKKIDQKAHTVLTEGGQEVPFEFLVVCNDLIPNPKDVKGMDQLIADGHVFMANGVESAQSLYKALDEFVGGTVVVATHAMAIRDDFSHTMVHMMDEFLRDRGHRRKSKLIFVTAGQELFPESSVHKLLVETAASKGIEVMLAHKLLSVDVEAKEALFAPLNEKGKPDKDAAITVSYDLLHFMPELVPPTAISKSKLIARRGDFKGFFSADPHTLQGKESYAFGLGQITNLPIPFSMEALDEQAEVVAHNVVAALQGRGPYTFKKYDGSSALPILLGRQQVLKADVGYNETTNDKGKTEVDGLKLGQSASASSFLWWFVRHLAPRKFWKKRLKRA